MSYEQLIEKIKALPEFQLEKVGLYIDSLENDNKKVNDDYIDKIHNKIIDGINQAHAGKLIDGDEILNSLTAKYGM